MHTNPKFVCQNLPQAIVLFVRKKDRFTMCVATVKCVLNAKRKTNSFEIMQLFLFTQTRLKLQF